MDSLTPHTTQTEQDAPETAAPETAAPETAEVAAPLETSGETPETPRRSLWWLDALLFLALFLAALPVRFANTSGDFWQDEADYALAGAQGFQANRWDNVGNREQGTGNRRGEGEKGRRGNPTTQLPNTQLPNYPITQHPTPDKIIVLRHFHAPMTAHLMQFARHWSVEDRTLRIPFVLAGGLVVGLVYLCGLALFDGRREIGVACAVALIVTPPHIRASSHALPWSLLILGLMTVLWTLLQYAQTRRPGWLVGMGAAFGGLFVTSEMFFPAALAVALVLPFLLWNDYKDAAKRKPLLLACAGGLGLFLIIVGVFWPAGLTGSALTMINHYIAVSKRPVGAFVGDRVYTPTPKWAYFYWYWHDYRPFFICYALGALAVPVLLALRKFTASRTALLVFSLVLLGSAHKAHIMGPEYLTHCLPFLTLLAGLFLLLVSRLHRWAGVAVGLVACVSLIAWKQPRPLAGMDARTQWPRWPAAARFLASQWQPDDRLLVAPLPVGVPRWYLTQYAGVPATESQVVQIPPAKLKDEFVQSVAAGTYRYVAISSTFLDRPHVDPQIRRILDTWPIVWQSEEAGAKPSRLIIYQAPRNSLPPPSLHSPNAPNGDAPQDTAPESQEP